MSQAPEIAVTQEMSEAAHTVISSLEAAFNRHGVVAISEHFAEEAAWATVMGKELAGREEIAEFGRTVIQNLADSYARYDITRLVALAPDVVAIRTQQRPVDADGAPTDAPGGAGLYVIARRGDRWPIVAGQITFVPEN